ncbi:hypothetical protein M0R04_07115 [Candidatus Dojkabacteria bacterium]|jgi:hypothetical protein|nr:hypothetical protein [Candidatus Dojkabacteria bacterium]
MPKPGEFNNNYPLLLEKENLIKLLEPFRGTKQHHKMLCMTCNHIWSATPLSKRQTYKKYGVSGCPHCNTQSRRNSTKAIQQVHLDKLEKMGVSIVGDYTALRTTTKKLKFFNKNCGHYFETYPGNVIELETTCTVCGKIERTSTITAWSKANSAKWKETATEWQQYKSAVSSLTEQIYNKYKKQINPTNLPRGKAGVDGAYHLDHIVPKRFCFDNNIPPELCADFSNLQMIGWLENIGSRNHIKGTIPPLFFQYISSNTKLEQYAKALLHILPNSKPFVRVADVITTVYDEESNRAIVVLPIDQSHANLKSGLSTYKSFLEAGIQFIILFEDEMNNTALLSAKLKHYTQLGMVQKIYARKCEIKACSGDEKRALLEINHVQGNDNAQISYGAYYDNSLVAVMTFTSPRVALGQKDKTKSKEGIWELSRFCTDITYRIPGIASKLLKHFQRNNEWKEIYSFADMRWSVGNMYQQLGFDLKTTNPPAYFYVVDGKRKHRWNYRKDIIKNTLPNYDASLTEYQNMQNNGYWRVWDCGTTKWVMMNNTSCG